MKPPSFHPVPNVVHCQICKKVLLAENVIYFARLKEGNIPFCGPNCGLVWYQTRHELPIPTWLTEMIK